MDMSTIAHSVLFQVQEEQVVCYRCRETANRGNCEGVTDSYGVVYYVHVFSCDDRAREEYFLD